MARHTALHLVERAWPDTRTCICTSYHGQTHGLAVVRPWPDTRTCSCTSMARHTDLQLYVHSQIRGFTQQKTSLHHPLSPTSPTSTRLVPILLSLPVQSPSSLPPPRLTPTPLRQAQRGGGIIISPWIKLDRLLLFQVPSLSTSGLHLLLGMSLGVGKQWFSYFQTDCTTFWCFFVLFFFVFLFVFLSFSL